MLYQAIYVSHATVAFDDAMLVGLLTKARGRNMRSNVSGLLLYRDGVFAQFLEGGQAEVDVIMDRVLADGRHGGIFFVLRGFHGSTRIFPNWSMGFNRLGAAFEGVRGLQGNDLAEVRRQLFVHAADIAAKILEHMITANRLAA